MANVHAIWSWIGPMILLDVARVGLHAHCPRLWWTNLLLKEVLRQAYETVSRSSHLIVDSILDIGRHSQVVRIADRSPMVVVNQGLYGILLRSGWWSPTSMKESVRWGFL
jgi:hypothetical protein